MSLDQSLLTPPDNHPLYKEPEWKIYGPYQRKADLRRHVIAYDGIKRITISYPKYVMECHLQRLLNKDEEVHHKNDLLFDDRLDNYEIVNGTEHRKEHMTKYTEENFENFICPVCDNMFQLSGVALRNRKSNERQGKTKGPYCSRSCNGKANH